MTTTTDLSATESETDHRLEGWMRRLTAASGLVLVASSYRLWFSNVNVSFPQVPLVGVLCDWPTWIDTTLSFALTAALVALVFARGKSIRFLWFFVLACVVGLVSLDQHRLQPWFYQLGLFACLFLLKDSSLKLRLMRALVISVYVYSAIGKMDFQFLHTVGQQFLTAMGETMGLDFESWNMGARVAVAWLLPVSELLIAGLLSYQPTRRVGGVFAVAFHVGLMLLLGVKLQHSAGVVLWNAQFAVQAVLLFCLPKPPTVTPLAALVVTWRCARDSMLNSCVVFITALAVLLPSAERLGCWDHWLSWALYAPHSSRVELFVAVNAVDELPEGLQALMREPVEGELWVEVPIGKWSLTELGVPVYPQARFELAVARRVASKIRNKFATRAVLMSHSNRFTGARWELELVGSEAIESAGNRFWLNTTPRQSFGKSLSQQVFSPGSQSAHNASDIE